ncbi:MAG: hypothetical protein LBH42_03075 [Treponema sp.]|jgi:hypothetical protein|nr:hypothetical protein [Treponema sp.]
MSKPHRGKSIRELPSRGRAECPVCKRGNVKLLYEMEAANPAGSSEKKVKVCKICKAAIKHGKKSVTGAQAEA